LNDTNIPFTVPYSYFRLTIVSKTNDSQQHSRHKLPLDATQYIMNYSANYTSVDFILDVCINQNTCTMRQATTQIIPSNIITNQNKTDRDGGSKCH